MIYLRLMRQEKDKMNEEVEISEIVDMIDKTDVCMIVQMYNLLEYLSLLATDIIEIDNSSLFR